MIKDIVTEVGKLAGKFIQDKDQQAAFEHELSTLAHQERMAQVDVNKEEAKHASWFVAGWRPFIGWICGVCLAYIVVGRDLLMLYAGEAALVLSDAQIEIVMAVLSILLGANIGARTLEKVKGVARERVK